MLEALLEIIIYSLGELVLQIVVEGLTELGFHSTAEKVSSRARSRLILGGAYMIFGAVLGYVSLFIFPKISFGNNVFPIFYFIVSPVVAGFALSIVSWLINRGTRPVSWFELDKFIYGVLFAVAYSLSRVAFG
jgi:hypothetical protein